MKALRVDALAVAAKVGVLTDHHIAPVLADGAGFMPAAHASHRGQDNTE